MKPNEYKNKSRGLRSIPQNVRARLLNNQVEVRASLAIAFESIHQDDPCAPHEQVTYGLRDPMMWDPSKQSWVQLPDKFHVTTPEFTTSKSEFWARWSKYCERKFKYRPQLTIISTCIDRDNFIDPDKARELHPS